MSGVSPSSPAEAGYRDFSYGSDSLSTPTGEKPESKLWFNDGYWWGSLYSDAAQSYHIYQLDPSTQCWIDTGTAVDDRSNSLADALWEGTTQKLYIVSHVFTKNAQPSTSPSQWGRLYRFSYQSMTRSYGLDTGFPIEVTGGKSETLVVAKDSTGLLWVTYVENSQVMVNHSLSSDLDWGQPFVIPVVNTDVTSDDISSIISFGINKIGVMWSNQKLKKFHFAVHHDGDSDQVWGVTTIAVPGPDPGASSDDHISLKSMLTDGTGRVFAAIKTSLSASDDPLVLILARDPDGSWLGHVFGLVRDHHTRPIVLIDEDNNDLFVFATTPESGGAIYFKSTPVDNINFESGLGQPFIQSSLDAKINNATSTKQNLGLASGLVVLASDQASRYYLHNHISLAPVHTLLVQTMGLGTVDLSPPGGEYVEGTLVSLTALPSPGFEFSAWSGDLAGFDNPATITMDSDKSVTATFSQLPAGQFSLMVSVVGPGSVSLSPPGGVYEDGTVVTLTAQPDPGAEFVGWSGDVSSTAPTFFLTIRSDTSLIATFAPLGASVAFEEVQTGASSASSGVTTAADVVAAADHLYLAVISAKPHQSVVAVSGLGLSWTAVGEQCSGRNQTGVVLWQAQGFPSGNGNVTATLAGVADNAVIAVSRYSGASGGVPIGNVISGNTTGTGGFCSGGTDSASYSFDLSTSADDSLVFAAVAMRNKMHSPGAGFTERVEVQQGVGGSVASVALQDQPVPLVAVQPVNGSFSASVDWAVIAAEILSSPVALPRHTLSVTLSGSGTVGLNPSGGSYDEGTVVTLTATAAAGFVFSGWGGDLSGSTNPATLTMDADKSVTATFTPGFTLSLTTSGSGSVAISPPGGVYAAGTVVTLTATPATGFAFGGWGGDINAASNPATLMMDSDKNVVALFEPLTKELVFEESQTGRSSGVPVVTTSAGVTGARRQLYLAAVATTGSFQVNKVSGLGMTWLRVSAGCSGRNQTRLSLWRGLGLPERSGKVTALLSAAPRNAVIAVVRYSGAKAGGPSVGVQFWANTNGIDGACSGGVDSTGYSMDLSGHQGRSLLFTAVTSRGHEHRPGPGYVRRARVGSSIGPNEVWLTLQDFTATPALGAPVNGTFEGADDWSLIAVKVLPAQR
ncbi:MAG: hypothetical protein ACE5JX_00040 [Acidobacteriota bacterium]